MFVPAWDGCIESIGDARTRSCDVHCTSHICGWIDMEEVQNLLHEVQRHQADLEQQNEELRKAQQRLEAYRDRYIDLYDFAPLGYVTLDRDGYVQEINLAGAKMLEVDRDALTGYAFGDYVAPEDKRAFLDHLSQCAGERREVASELRLLSAGGRSVTVQLRSIPIEGAADDILCKTAITDITERKNMADALEQERDLLRTLIDNLPDCIFVKDAQMRFVTANLAAARMIGTGTPDDLVGKTDADFYSPERAAECRADEDVLLQSGQPLLNREGSFVDESGRTRTFVTTKIPLKDSRGKVFGLVGISRDISKP
jgi:PAS domain S-box-containing protein